MTIELGDTGDSAVAIQDNNGDVTIDVPIRIVANRDDDTVDLVN